MITGHPRLGSDQPKRIGPGNGRHTDNSKRKGSIPTCNILWLRVMFMVMDILRLDLAVNSVSKPLNRVEKIPNFMVMNSANRWFHCSYE